MSAGTAPGPASESHALNPNFNTGRRTDRSGEKHTHSRNPLHQVACSLNKTRGWPLNHQGWPPGRDAAFLSSIRYFLRQARRFGLQRIHRKIPPAIVRQPAASDASNGTLRSYSTECSGGPVSDLLKILSRRPFQTADNVRVTMQIR